MFKQRLEIELPSVSVIVPAYNEEKTIKILISSILDSGFPCELIVVDDGSTDRTAEIVQSFGNKIKLLTHEKNRGKDTAMASGLKVAEGEIIVFLDADLLGLKRYHLLSLVLPLVEDVAEVVICIVTPKIPLGSLVYAKKISGQRAYFKKDLLPLLHEFEGLGYGIETFLNKKLKDKKTLFISAPEVTFLTRYNKWPIREAFFSYLKGDLERVKVLVDMGELKPEELARSKNELFLIMKKYAKASRGRAGRYLRKVKDLSQKQITIKKRSDE